MTLDPAEIDLGRVGVPYGAGAAGKDHSLHIVAQGRNFVERVDFTIDI